MRRVLAATHTPCGRIIMMDFKDNLTLNFSLVSEWVCMSLVRALQSNNKVRNVRTSMWLLQIRTHQASVVYCWKAQILQPHNHTTARTSWPPGNAIILPSINWFGKAWKYCTTWIACALLGFWLFMRSPRFVRRISCVDRTNSVFHTHVTDELAKRRARYSLSNFQCTICHFDGVGQLSMSELSF